MKKYHVQCFLHYAIVGHVASESRANHDLSVMMPKHPHQTKQWIDIYLDGRVLCSHCLHLIYHHRYNFQRNSLHPTLYHFLVLYLCFNWANVKSLPESEELPSSLSSSIIFILFDVDTIIGPASVRRLTSLLDETARPVALFNWLSKNCWWLTISPLPPQLLRWQCWQWSTRSPIPLEFFLRCWAGVDWWTQDHSTNFEKR